MTGFLEDRSQGRPVELVLLTADASVGKAIQEALQEAPSTITVTTVETAEQALASVPQARDDQLFPAATLLLADRVSAPEPARALLDRLKSTPSKRRAPVIVLVEDPEDVMGLYRSYANALVSWPSDHQARVERLRAMLEFWLTVPALP